MTDGRDPVVFYLGTTDDGKLQSARVTLILSDRPLFGTATFYTEGPECIRRLAVVLAQHRLVRWDWPVELNPPPPDHPTTGHTLRSLLVIRSERK